MIHPFHRRERTKTMESVFHSDLKLISLVEPVGYEHTNEEIADRFLTAVQYGASICGAMARVPVKGTPLGEAPIISESRLAQITAVLRLSGGSTVKDICVHPASAEAVESGANVLVVETGAIPRDTALSPDLWENFNMMNAKAIFSDAGYVLNKETQNSCADALSNCACAGRNLEKFIQPIILSALKKNAGITGYKLIEVIGSFATFRDKNPDPTGMYRYLHAMVKSELIEKRTFEVGTGAYYITEKGNLCLKNWRNTLTSYQKALGELIEEL